MKVGGLADLIEWVDGINRRASSDLAEVVVEGRRDERALRLLGVRARFVRASDLLRELRDEGEARVRGRVFIILTDFDKEGIKIYEKLKKRITSCGGNVDDMPRVSYLRMGLPPLLEEIEGFLERRFPDWDLIIGSRSEWS